MRYFNEMMGTPPTMVPRLQPFLGMDRARPPVDHSMYRVSAIFARGSGRWDARRTSLMLLPVVPAILLVGLVMLMQAGVPGARVSIETASYLDTTGLPGPTEAALEFRSVYAKVDGRVIEATTLLQAVNPDLDESTRRSLGVLLVQLGEYYRYDPSLILAVIMTESSFDPQSRSHMGALGLMQLRPETGESMAVETQRNWAGAHTLFDPYLNISLGVRYLAKLQKRFGTLEVALTAYNHGPTRVDDLLRRGEPLPMGYAQRVLNQYRQFRSLEASASL